MIRALPWLLATLALLVAGAPLASAQEVTEDPVPEEIRWPSSVGEAVFPHRLHTEDLGFECASCHHETEATALTMPHESYFDDFWIDCGSCHRRGAAAARPQSCATCHHASPVGIADETSSAKVVVHQSCWQCHEMETGAAASRACVSCHSGPRREF